MARCVLAATRRREVYTVDITNDSEMDALFEAIDRDKSGFIELTELNSLLRKGADIELAASLQVGARAIGRVGERGEGAAQDVVVQVAELPSDPRHYSYHPPTIADMAPATAPTRCRPRTRRTASGSCSG